MSSDQDQQQQDQNAGSDRSAKLWKKVQIVAGVVLLAAFVIWPAVLPIVVALFILRTDEVRKMPAWAKAKAKAKAKAVLPDSVGSVWAFWSARSRADPHAVTSVIAVPVVAMVLVLWACRHGLLLLWQLL